MSTCAPASPSAISTRGSLRFSATRATSVLNWASTNSMSRSSSTVRSRKVSSPSLPRSRAIAATVLPSSGFRAGQRARPAPRVGAGLGHVVALEQGEEGYRPAAFREQERQQLGLVLGHHRGGLRQGDLDRALASIT